MFDERLAVAEYFRVNKIDWPIEVVAYAVVAVAVSAVAVGVAVDVAAVSIASMVVHFDIDQLDTCDTD